MNKTQYEYINKWWTIEEIREHLKTLTSDEDRINEVLRDVLKYAKVRYLVEK